MKTLGRFVLVDNLNKKQILLDWQNDKSQSRTLAPKPNREMNYTDRKNIISNLSPLKQSSQAGQQQARAIQTSSSARQLVSYFYTNPERGSSAAITRAPARTFYRTMSMGKVSKPVHNQQPKIQGSSNKIDKLKLLDCVEMADRKKGRPICIIKMRRNGLRFKISYEFLAVYKQLTHSSLTQMVKQTLFAQFEGIGDKNIYFFHLSREPINKIESDINPKQYVIFADISPKLDIPFELQMKMFEQASLLEQAIKEATEKYAQLKMQLAADKEPQIQVNQLTEVFEWERIGDTKKYVENLIDNPLLAKKMCRSKSEKQPVERWCQERFTNNEQKSGIEEKNPFLDVDTHFPNETVDVDGLQQAAIKMNFYPAIVSKHEVKNKPIVNMMEKIKRENQNAERIRKEVQKKSRTLGYKSEKNILKQLDRKNVPLFKQNIPYIMEKYGINRAEAYNLYNLYKSLQKISAMRLFPSNNFPRVRSKGIDRKTFDEGLKGLQINPGEQVIRNICDFPEFISWEQFIKIISISMRKTPKSKIEAILQGLGNTSSGELSREQIEIMVGSSLYKIFGKDEPQLKKHFVSVVMKVLDKDNSNTIDVDELKQHVLEKGGLQNLDLVTYLLLNS